MQEPKEMFDPFRPRCIYVMPDGSIECRYCGDTGGGEEKGLAPVGTKLGKVDREILNRVTNPGE